MEDRWGALGGPFLQFVWVCLAGEAVGRKANSVCPDNSKSPPPVLGAMCAEFPNIASKWFAFALQKTIGSPRT